jgi:hypothetical protein
MIRYISKYNLVARIKKFFDKKNFDYEKNFYNRISFINKAISKFGYDEARYLEIGVDKNLVFNSIPVPLKNKIGVDPLNGGTHRMTSDNFFKINKDKFHVIFLDGDHNYKQVKIDLINSIKVLHINGILFLHDVLPRSELEQAIPQQIDIWTGDVWKLVLEIIENSKNLEIFIANIDRGVCMIKPKNNIFFGNTEDYKNINYKDFIERLYNSGLVINSETFINKI